MFHNRHFEKEESGANVRQVYQETQHAKISRSGSNRHDEARRLLTSLGTPVEGLEFTCDGMNAFLRSARFEYFRGVIAQKLGNESGARDHWSEAAKHGGVYAVLPARELGQPGWRDRAGKLVSQYRDSRVERGLALLALGRTNEARTALH